MEKIFKEWLSVSQYWKKASRNISKAGRKYPGPGIKKLQSLKRKLTNDHKYTPLLLKYFSFYLFVWFCLFNLSLNIHESEAQKVLSGDIFKTCFISYHQQKFWRKFVKLLHFSLEFWTCLMSNTNNCSSTCFLLASRN